MSVVFSLDRASSKSYASRKSQDKNGLYLKGDSGSTVILIHGLTGTPNEMKFLANFLNRKGYSVICPRLANHGETISVLKNTKWQDFYESVREVVIGRGPANNTGPVFAAGLSMGALLALLLADEFKDRVHGVSCIAPTLFYDGWNAPRSKYLLPLAYYTFLKYLFYFKEEPPYGIKNETIQDRVHRYYSVAKLDDMKAVAQYGYPYFPVRILYEHHRLVKYFKKRMPYITVPTQLIQAKDDDMTSVKNSQVIYNGIKSDVKEIVLLHDSYHVIVVDQERQKVADEMDRFFTNIQK